MTEQQTVTLEHEGDSLKGQLVSPAEGDTPRPGVLVVHDAMGLSAFAVDKARQLAQLGYAAVAVDMYGDGVYCEKPEEAGKYFIRFRDDSRLLRSRISAWHEKLAGLAGVDHSRIAAIGYCFGGRCVLELARSGAEVRAVVSYHGLLTTEVPARPGDIGGLVAVYTGSKDPYAPPAEVAALKNEMAAAGATFHLTEFSNAYHAFTNPNPPGDVAAGMQYDEVCDRVSWGGTLALLASVLAR